MSNELTALVAHARDVPAADRARLAGRLRELTGPGVVLLETCHRVELYAVRDTVEPLAAARRTNGVCVLGQGEVAEHLVRLAVGRESVVLAEDQILHQLRHSVHQARGRGPLPPALDRLLDLALRAGRRARSWLPARRPSLADLALDRVAGGRGISGTHVLVVGTGEMGRLAAEASAARGARVTIASRTRARAVRLGAELGLASSEMDPGPAVMADLAGVVLALAGRWLIDRPSAEALRGAPAWIVDLSSPPALAPELGAAFAGQLVTIDDLARVDGPRMPHALVTRLDALVADTLAAYRAWEADEPQRVAAQALAERAAEARETELAALWRRVPDLAPEQRAEVEEMAERLALRLIRDPLERLHDDRDGRRGRAARELFGL